MCFKRVFSFLLTFAIMLSGMTFSASALSEEEITAPSAILMEPNSQKVLFEYNSHEQRPCASITKVMTMLLVMEAIDSGKISYDDTVKGISLTSATLQSDFCCHSLNCYLVLNRTIIS